ncbi:MAG: Ada metal-binding domain-containing protein [Chlorobiales bacterium]|nr:Ada metal-binding domain-containing protein [Chlorobiales bacterium]
MMKGKRSARTAAAWLVVLILAIPAIIAAEDSATVYHGNTKSKVFHRPGCRYYNCSKCTAKFSGRQRAVEEGYRPCKVCKP